ncbi:MAG: DNA polymerase Y family protein [Pseudolabrys sp.]|nr:DNA polymerase Y family protein [Pseudolabrys sp.]
MSALFSRQRILSLWLPRLSTDRLERLGDPSHETKPTVIYGKRGSAELIVALDAQAERLGLSKGLALAQARAMHPDILAIEEDGPADAKLLDHIADWCLRYTPLIACDAPGSLLLDITGCAHLYGGEENLVADLASRLKQARVAQRMAVAGTIGAAYALTRCGQCGLYENSKERDFLAPLPLSALRIAAETSASLNRVGLKRIGDIIDLPRAPLAARFGIELLRQLDRALGREEEPLTPRLPVAPYIAEQRFAEPILLEAHVLTTIERLAARLKPALEQRGEGARRLELILFRTDGVLRRLIAGTSQPLRNPAEIRGLFAERLAALADEYDPGFGFDMARLSVVSADTYAEQQIGLTDTKSTGALPSLIDHLSARLGAQRVQRLIARNTHVPELASTTQPAQIESEDDGWDAFRRHKEQGIGPRPLRLLSKPEPITAIAEVPDGPPQRFWWRNALHEVIAAEGPERIERTWWTDEDSAPRDYFRVEDQSGLRFWLFRAGLYRDLTPHDLREGRVPQWFMHGAFA